MFRQFCSAFAVCTILSHFSPGVADPTVAAEFFATPPTIHVLAIGVSQYQDPTLPNLPGVENDLKLFVAALRSLTGRAILASVTTLTNTEVTKGNVFNIYHKIVSQANPNDLIIIYWSGISSHASQSRVQLFTYNSQRTDPSDTFTLQEILAATPSDQKLLIISDISFGGDESLGRLLDTRPYAAIISSSKADELAWSENGFTRSLVNVLTSEDTDLDGDGQLSVEELYVQLYPKMFIAPALYPKTQHPSRASHPN
jgi:hypothetical protein